MPTMVGRDEGEDPLHARVAEGPPEADEAEAEAGLEHGGQLAEGLGEAADEDADRHRPRGIAQAPPRR